jgi:hypothetical protein
MSSRIKVVVAWLLAVASPLMAWQESGHRAVALVAERHLSPVAQNYVASILRHHPERVGNLSDASCWPDQVRNRPEYHHGSWHFLNLPVFLDVPERPVEVTGDILWALNECTRILKDRQADPAARAIALAWLVHLVGDLHQPLHAANGYSSRFPDGDRGGGLVKVRMGEAPTSLHIFWDSGGGLFWNGANESRLDTIVDGWMAFYPADPNLLAARDPGVWAQESHRLAAEVSYAGVVANERLDQAYIARARKTSQQRLTLAGYRLASYIERLADGAVAIGKPQVGSSSSLSPSASMSASSSSCSPSKL